MIRRIIIALLAVGFFSSRLPAATIYVAPGGQHIPPFSSWANAATSIASAVDLSVDGDLVLVSNGFYAVYSPVMVNKGITVMGFSGSAATIVHGSYTSACFQIMHSNAVVDGFTITGGGGPLRMGGGVFMSEGATLQHCVVTGNVATLMGGGGIYLNIGGTISNCVIAGNRAENDGDGGGVYAHRDGVIVDCIIRDNEARTGGGIAALYYNRISGSSIEGNTASQGGGALISHRSEIIQSTIRSNQAVVGGGLCGFSGGRVINTTISMNTASADPDTNLVSTVSGQTCFDSSCPVPPAITPESGQISYYVATNGNDAASGRSATQAFQTVQRGLDALAEGNTLVIGPGIYREYAIARRSGSPTNGPAVVGSGNLATVLRGSDVATNWQLHTGNVWKVVDWPVSPQQVFANGETLTRLDWPNIYLQTFPATYTPPGYSIADLAPGRFWYDVTGRTVYAQFPGNANPTGLTVEISTRVQVLDGIAMAGLRLENLRFEHANTFTHSPGGWTMVRIPDHGSLKSCTVSLSDGVGISLRHNGQIIDSGIISNGLYGIFMETNNLVEHSRVLYNTYRPFNPDWNSGGIRVIPPFCSAGSGMAGGVIQHNEIAWNNGYGVWFDQCTGDVPRIVRNNYVHHNLKAGIMFEISRGGEIYNNLVVSNRGGSIWISGSDLIQAYNNTLAFNEGWVDIYVHGIPRSMCEINGNPTWASVVSNSLVNNLMYESRCQFDVGMLPDSYTVSNRSFGNTWNHNLYYSTNNTYLFSLSGIASYTSVSNWNAATGWDAQSTHQNPSVDAFLKPLAGSPLIDRGDTTRFPPADYAGTPRALDGDSTNGVQPDIGAFEYVNPNSDSDGDGMRDGDEIRAGTHPLDTNSFLRIGFDTPSTNEPAALEWAGSSARVYRISRATNLLNGFTPWKTNIPAELPWTRSILEASEGNAFFYRLELED